MEHHLGTRFTIWIYKRWGCSQNLLQHLNRNMNTWRHTRNKYIFEFVCSDHRMVIEDRSSGHISIEHVVSNIIKGLFSCFVLEHVKRIIYFSCIYTFAPSFDCVYRRRQVLYLGFSQHSFMSYFIVSQTFADSC